MKEAEVARAARLRRKIQRTEDEMAELEERNVRRRRELERLEANRDLAAGSINFKDVFTKGNRSMTPDASHLHYPGPSTEHPYTEAAMLAWIANNVPRKLRRSQRWALVKKTEGSAMHCVRYTDANLPLHDPAHATTIHFTAVWSEEEDRTWSARLVTRANRKFVDEE